MNNPAYERGFFATGTLDFAAATAMWRAASRVCVIGHVNPDPDAIGSICAVRWAAEQQGKEVTCVIGQRNPIDPALLHIPGASEIMVQDHLPDADVYVVVDCGGLSRTGALQPGVLREGDRVILVDHHATNRGFGVVNLIDYRAESTTTVLHDWFAHLDIQLDYNIAYALYAGLASDTAGFRWGRPSMHDMAQRLLAYELDIREISSRLFDGTTIDELQLLGSVLAELQLHEAGNNRVVIATARYQQIRNATLGAVEKIADAIRGTSDAEVAVVFKEVAPGEWAVSLRSHEVNVANIARSCGGGGHLRAAGYTTFGTAEHVIAEVLHAIEQNA